MNRDYIVGKRKFWVAELKFCETLADGTKKDDEKQEWKRLLRGQIGAMDDDTIRGLAEISRRQYDEQEATRGSVASRASALLLFVGVVSTGTTIVASSLTTTSPIVLLLTLGAGACLLYACLAVAWLAVRAQEVTMWEVPAVYPEHATDPRALAVTDAVEAVVAYQQNRGTLCNVVAYLASAQRWARRAIVLVVMLAILSVAATATKPTPAQGQTPAASPASDASPDAT